MTHHEGFLAAILAEPEEDSHRLVYADWLDENGNSERAEFVRVQCRLARLDERHCGGYYCHAGDDGSTLHVDCGWWRLHARERELLEPGGLRHLPGPFWRAGGNHGWTYLDAEGARVGVECQFRRGFVAEVTLPCAEWMRHGPALVRAVPLERVTLSDCRPAEHERYFAWYRCSLAGIPEHVPAALYDLLTGGVPSIPQGTMSEYRSAAEARDDLSRACLKWARNPVPATH
jgi:uncharacterized protein (TIGR02996 family)